MITYLPSIPIRLPADWTLTWHITDEGQDEFGDSIYGLLEDYELRAPETEEMINYISISRIESVHSSGAMEAAHIYAEEEIRELSANNPTITYPSSDELVKETTIKGRIIYYFNMKDLTAEDLISFDLYGYMNAPNGDLLIIGIALRTKYKKDQCYPNAAWEYLADLGVFEAR